MQGRGTLSCCQRWEQALHSGVGWRHSPSTASLISYCSLNTRIRCLELPHQKGWQLSPDSNPEPPQSSAGELLTLPPSSPDVACHRQAGKKEAGANQHGEQDLWEQAPGRRSCSYFSPCQNPPESVLPHCKPCCSLRDVSSDHLGFVMALGTEACCCNGLCYCFCYCFYFLFCCCLIFFSSPPVKKPRAEIYSSFHHWQH